MQLKRNGDGLYRCGKRGDLRQNPRVARVTHGALTLFWFLGGSLKLHIKGDEGPAGWPPF